MVADNQIGSLVDRQLSQVGLEIGWLFRDGFHPAEVHNEPVNFVANGANVFDDGWHRQGIDSPSRVIGRLGTRLVVAQIGNPLTFDI